MTEVTYKNMKDWRIILKWIQESMPLEYDMLETHSHELCSIKGEVFLSVVKIDILFLPQNNPCLDISMPVAVFLGGNLWFLDILSVN